MRESPLVFGLNPQEVEAVGLIGNVDGNPIEALLAV